MSSYFDTGKLRQASFIAILLALGFVLFRELQQFIPAFLGAITLFVIMRKYMRSLVKHKKWKPGTAAAVLMLLSFLIILIPIFCIVTLMSAKISFAVNHSNDMINSFTIFLENLERKFGTDYINEETMKEFGQSVAKLIPSVLGATFNTLTTLVIMYFLLYFMLISTRTLDYLIYKFVPVQDDNNVNRISDEVNNMVISNAVGIPLIALLQGVVGLIGYLIIGVKEPFLWFAVTCITAMLPVIGAALAYVPLTIMLFVSGPAWKGFAMLVYGFGVIGLVDNVFRFTLQKKIGNIHPLITIFGVIIGIDLFGFIGLIFGPLLISLFILLVKIYLKEFHRPRQNLRVTKKGS